VPKGEKETKVISEIILKISLCQKEGGGGERENKNETLRGGAFTKTERERWGQKRKVFQRRGGKVGWNHLKNHWNGGELILGIFDEGVEGNASE